MLKKLSFFALVALAAASCNNKESHPECQIPVNVHLYGLSVSQEEFDETKAVQDAADYTSINNLTVAFYSGSTEVAKVTQIRGNTSSYETFGEFSFSLPMGSYTMVALAYKTTDDSPFELTSPTSAAFTGAHALETFASTQTVNIDNTSAVDVGAVLNRLVSKLVVQSSDGKTANVSKIRMSFSAGAKAFNPSTGLATSNTGFSNTVPISAAVGAASNSASYLFLVSDEQKINVTIESLDEDGNTLFSKTVPNVSFKRNRKTILTGALYTNDALGGSFQIETAWEDDSNVNF